jgi:hypothetical protein
MMNNKKPFNLERTLRNIRDNLWAAISFRLDGNAFMVKVRKDKYFVSHRYHPGYGEFFTDRKEAKIYLRKLGEI